MHLAFWRSWHHGNVFHPKGKCTVLGVMKNNSPVDYTTTRVMVFV